MIDPAVGPTKKPPKTPVRAEEDDDSPNFRQVVSSVRKKYELMKTINKDLKIQDVKLEYESAPMSPMSKTFHERSAPQPRIWGPPGRNAAAPLIKIPPEEKGALVTTDEHDSVSFAKEDSDIPVLPIEKEGKEMASPTEPKDDLDESGASFHSAVSMPYDSPVAIMNRYIFL